MALADLAPAPSGADPDLWAQACAAVRNFCRWHIAPSITETVTRNGRGGHTLILPTKMLTKLSSVTTDGDAVVDPEWATEGIVRRHDGLWSRRLRGVELSMTHGYDECPEEIIPILSDLVKLAQATGASSIQAGPFNATFGSSSAASQGGVVGLSQAQECVLLPYRLEPSF